MTTCPRCGRPSAADAGTCAGCGYRLASGDEVETRVGPSRDSDVPTHIVPPSQASGAAPPGAGSAPSIPLEPGQDLGPRYAIQAVLGEGGMGAVYKAHDRELDRTVALKVIRPGMVSQPGVLERFKREILLASKVTHKNVLRIHDLGEVGDIRFISMHYVEGSDLAALLRSEGPLSLDRGLPFVRQIADALRAAHEAGVVHRDLKPQNILIDAGGNAYIADFGISRSLETGGTMTEAGSILGTIDYMSPEQARGETADHRSDIYSLGVILYQMFTGSLPFRSDNPLSIMMRRVHEDAPTIRQTGSQVPVWISAIVSRAMQRDIAARYQSVADLIRDLDRHRASIAWRRLITRAAVPVVAGGLALAVAGYYLTQRWSAPGAPAPPASLPSHAVAFLPFANGTGSPEFDWIRTGFPALVSNGLRESPEIRLLGGDRTHRTLADLKLAQSGNYGPFDLKRAATVLGADFLVTGVVRRAGDLFQAETRLQQPVAQGVQEIGLQQAQGRGEEAIFALADSLAEQIARRLEVRPSDGAGSRRATTESVEALRLYSLGLDLTREGRNVDAAARLEEAVASDPGFALAHALLSQAYDRLGERDRAVAASDRAVRNLGGVAAHEARLIRARHARLANRLDDGIKEYRELLRSYPNDAEAHFELAGLLEQKGVLDKAAAEFERSTALDPKHAQALYGLGRVRTKMGDTEAALKIFNDLLAAHTQAGNEEGRGAALLALGNVQWQMSRYDEALGYFRQSVEVRSAAGDRSGMAVALGAMAYVLRLQGQHDEAIETSRQALDILREIGDRRRTADEWRNLGEIYEAAGRIRDAQECYQGSLKIVRDLDDPRLLAQTYSSLGYVASVLGDYVQAYFFYQEGLSKRREIGDRPEILRSLIDLQLIEQVQGRYDKSLAYAAEAVDLARETGEKAGEYVVAANLGMLHDDQGSYAAALKTLTETVEGARGMGDRNLLAQVLTFLGGALAHVGRGDEAEERLGEAEQLAKETGAEGLWPEILVARAAAQAVRGAKPPPLQGLEEALRRAEALGDRRLILLARLDLGRWSLAAGRPNGRSHLTWVAEEAGKSAVLPLQVRSLAYLAAAGLAGDPGPDDAATAERVIKEGSALKLRESLILANRVLTRRARSDGRYETATRLYLQTGQLLREMAEGLEEPYLTSLLSRPDLADLRERAVAHISEHGTADDRDHMASLFP